MMEKYFGKDEQSSHAQPKMEQARSKVVVDKKIVVEEAVLPIKDHVVRSNLLQERERMMGSHVQRNKGASMS